MKRISQRAKRLFDLGVLLIAHILLLPVWVLLWVIIPLAIVIDSGRPVFYRDEKVGKDGVVFGILKFRTMIPDADKIGPPTTVPDDERITRVGKWLRKSALDEMPQLLAILKGEMSFVGPRAYNTRSHAEHMVDDPRFARRLQAVPGLTGLAAVYGNPDDPRNRLAWDILYLRRQDLWLDIKLLTMSVLIAANLGWERKQPLLQKPIQVTKSPGAESRDPALVGASVSRAARGDVDKVT